MSEQFGAWVRIREKEIVGDIKRLVDIRSVKDQAQPGAPYGAGVRAVQLEAMEMCREIGLEVTDLDGRIAYGHYGDPERFIGIVAHLDVVPEGTGWDTDPYDATVRDGFLVGRGTTDDKGPFVLALWAVRYLVENSIDLNYGIRLIIGLDEETGMSDLQYYNTHCTAPVFAFTPDAEFPVGHGEKGIFSGNLVSPKMVDRVVQNIHGGVASNVVPDTAHAQLGAEHREVLRNTAAGRDDILVSEGGGVIDIEAKGLACHAGEPDGGIDAIHVLLHFLLETGLLHGAEEQYVRFMAEASGDFSGKQFGIDCEDGLFTPLTIIAGMVSVQDNCFVLNVNSRYPTAITSEDLVNKIEQTCAAHEFSLRDIENSGPFYLSPEHAAVQLLCEIYNEITGRDEKPFVMSGGTYARHMKNTVSYGMDPPDANFPEWVGTAHMKNEAVSIELALQACEIFINTLIRLQDIELA